MLVLVRNIGIEPIDVFVIGKRSTIEQIACKHLEFDCVSAGAWS